MEQTPYEAKTYREDHEILRLLRTLGFIIIIITYLITKHMKLKQP